MSQRNRKFLNPLVGYLIIIVVVFLLILGNIVYLHGSLNQEKVAILNRKIFDEDIDFFNNDLDDYMDLFILTQTKAYSNNLLVKKLMLDVSQAPLVIKVIENDFDNRAYYDGMAFIYEMMDDEKGYRSLSIENQHYRVRYDFDKINDRLMIDFLKVNDFVESEYFLMFTQKYGQVEFSIYDNHHRVIADNVGAPLQSMELVKYESKYGFQIEKYIETIEGRSIDVSIFSIIVLVLLNLIIIGVVMKKLVNLYEIEEKAKAMKNIVNEHTMALEKNEKMFALLEEKLMESREIIKKQREELEQVLGQNFKSELRYFDAERFATLGKLTFGMILSNFKPLEEMGNRLVSVRKYLTNLEERMSNRNLNDNYFETVKNSYNEELRQIKENNDKCIHHIEDYKELILDFEEKRIRSIDPYVFLSKILENFDVSTLQLNIKIKVESTKGYELKTYPSTLTQFTISLLSGIIKYSFRLLKDGNIWIAIHDTKDHIILTVLDDGDRLSDAVEKEMKEFVEEWQYFQTTLYDLVKIHLKGDIDIGSRKLKGTEYNIKLPKNLMKKT